MSASRAAMSPKDIDTTPYWSSSAAFPQSVRLAEDAEADVVVVGAGITGLTAAHALATAGQRVVV